MYPWSICIISLNIFTRDASYFGTFVLLFFISRTFLNFRTKNITVWFISSAASTCTVRWRDRLIQRQNREQGCVIHFYKNKLLYLLSWNHSYFIHYLFLSITLCNYDDNRGGGGSIESG